MTDIERLACGLVEIKFAGDAAPGTFRGYGAVFGNVDAHGDVIEPGAFADSLRKMREAGRSLPMYAQHAIADLMPVGVWTKVEEDAHGLAVEGRISALDTDFGKRVHALVRDGALAGLSIGYRVPQGGASYPDKAAIARRILKRIDLVEISLVDDPANALARVARIKSLAPGEQATPKFVEQVLREAGLPRALAKGVVAGGLRAAAGRRDDDGEAVKAAADAVSATAADITRFMKGLLR